MSDEIPEMCHICHLPVDGPGEEWCGSGKHPKVTVTGSLGEFVDLGTPDVIANFGEQYVCECGYFKVGAITGSPLWSAAMRCPHCGRGVEFVPVVES